MSNLILQSTLLKKLYLEYYHSLFLYARSVLQDPSLAEEAVQDTFCIACVKQEQLAASGNPAGWLVQTLKNVLRNMERSHSSLYSLCGPLLCMMTPCCRRAERTPMWTCCTVICCRRRISAF